MSANYVGQPWEDPRFQQDSKFVKWNAPGDTVVGILRGWSEDAFPEEDGKPARPYPVMHLDTAHGEKEMGLTLADLKSQIFAAKPGIGDSVSVKYLRDGKPKLFHVEVTRAVPVVHGTDTGPMPGANPSNPIQAGLAGQYVTDEAPF